MRARERHALEGALRDHYRAGEAAAAAPRALVEAVARELARPVRPGPLEVVAAQVRRIGAAAWVLHGALVLVVAVLALSGAPVDSAVGAVGAALGGEEGFARGLGDRWVWTPTPGVWTRWRDWKVARRRSAWSARRLMVASSSSRSSDS